MHMLYICVQVCVDIYKVILFISVYGQVFILSTKNFWEVCSSTDMYCEMHIQPFKYTDIQSTAKHGRSMYFWHAIARRSLCSDHSVLCIARHGGKH